MTNLMLKNCLIPVFTHIWTNFHAYDQPRINICGLHFFGCKLTSGHPEFNISLYSSNLQWTLMYCFIIWNIEKKLSLFCAEVKGTVWKTGKKHLKGIICLPLKRVPVLLQMSKDEIIESSVAKLVEKNSKNYFKWNYFLYSRVLYLRRKY